jgi:Tfp pilus assembly protein PilX
VTTRIDSHRGAALVIALALLLIVTLLATAGMAVSTAEFVMAGNEQFHRNAIDSASAGVEVAIARLAASETHRHAAVSAEGQTVSGDYVAHVRFAGEEANLPGFSAEKFSALHFEIDSSGASARSARDRQFQGVMVIESQGATQTFTRAGDGFGGGG